MSATVIIPTTGAYETYDAIESVLYQTYESDCYLVCDGQMFFETTKLIYNKFEGYTREAVIDKSSRILLRLIGLT
jgi:phage major head subunit gpT-like protein